MTIPHRTSTCGIICTFWTRQKGQHNIISSRLNAITAEQLGPSKCRSAMLICNNNNKSQARAQATSHQHKAPQIQHSADFQTSASNTNTLGNAKHEPPSATHYIVLAALRKKRRAHDLEAVLPDNSQTTCTHGLFKSRPVLRPTSRAFGTGTAQVVLM